MPHKRTQFLFALMFLFAAIGIVDSVLIHLKEIDSLTNTNAFASCKINSLLDCGLVAKSPYARFFGVPVSLLGIIFYSATSALAFTFATGYKASLLIYWLLSGFFIFSLLFSLRLIYYSYFGVGALCPYCLVSNFTTLGVTITWFIYLLQSLKLEKKKVSGTI